jgi:hypothetical protein
VVFRSKEKGETKYAGRESMVRLRRGDWEQGSSRNIDLEY